MNEYLNCCTLNFWWKNWYINKRLTKFSRMPSVTSKLKWSISFFRNWDLYFQKNNTVQFQWRTTINKMRFRQFVSTYAILLARSTQLLFCWWFILDWEFSRIYRKIFGSITKSEILLVKYWLHRKYTICPIKKGIKRILCYKMRPPSTTRFKNHPDIII